MKSKMPCVALAALLFIPGLAPIAATPAPHTASLAGALMVASALPPGANPSTPSGSATPGTPKDTKATNSGAGAEQTPKATERKRTGKTTEGSGSTKRNADQGKTRQTRPGASGTR
ncbi:hypothetical protein [Pseudomonas huanghezhanensis]|uniref:hypothetical protein n=1 Tax=Pseudomonas huanghezhanensis TaxID=3002903 RepID=UPI0022854D2E|nr:hypothetical protein [Pseudomonas sp. BSw22131]